jgi:hypothetical protein
MKKLLFAYSFVLVSFFAVGQSFEGVLKYDLKYDGEMVQQFASMMPNSYTLKVKGEKARFGIQGGMVASFMGDFITDGSGVSYMLMPAQKTAYKLVESAADVAKDELTYKVLSTGITETVKGYKCTKYKITTKGENGEDLTSYLWASKDLSIKLPQSSNKQNALRPYKGVEGFPVKIEQNVSQMGVSFSMTIVLSELKEATIADNEFKVPAEFKVQEGFPSLGGLGK